ncbi:4-alpha-glucanotransferase DPE2 [Linum perenne]
MSKLGTKSMKSVKVSFRIPYFTNWGQSLLVCGSEPALGSWNVKRGLSLSPVHQDDELIWSGSVTVPEEFSCEYSYYVVDGEKNVMRWEMGKKREVFLPKGINGGDIVEFRDLWQTGDDDIPFRSAFKNVIFNSSWNMKVERPLGVQSKLEKEDSILVHFRICCPNMEEDTCAMPWRGTGVSIPMFSVRSEHDLGVGEFLDLKLLVDWAVESGFHLVQLLPINDTSVNGMWWDSYPYSSLSVCALHPLYLRVQALSANLQADVKKEIQEAKERLDGKEVDYEASLATKLSIAKKVFAKEKDAVLNSSAFQEFLSENEEWLKPYAAFCFLRDFFETSDHSQWGRFSHFSKEKLEKLISKDSVHYDLISFHYYIQFHLHIQLSEAAQYARKKGVVLKGDLPIGVDKNSVDTWVYPSLFRMNTSTGAPPDYFDKNGQNWGFPTYNWEEMSKDNYGWWRARLTQEELEKEGIWDFDRLSRPYIRKEFLQEKFGKFWAVIASTFLNEFQKGFYEFQEDCNTEKKIASKVKTMAEESLLSEGEDKIRRDLFDLLKNIVLIRDPEDARKFYPRFNLEDTSSFQDLDEQSKNVLKRLYYDYYFHRQEDLWRKNAMKTLPALLNSSDMLACGEDLGLIPACVHPVMQDLGLIGLRIQRMPSEPDLEFGIPSQYSYMTVCAPSCHDCSTLRAWWEEDAERRQRYFKNIIGSDELPPDTCLPAIAHFVIRQHIESPTMWAIFPLQDLLALKEEYTKRPANEETINDPTNPKHYWRYRVHVTLETLMKDNELKSTIKSLVSGSGRSFPGAAQAVKKEVASNGKVAGK